MFLLRLLKFSQSKNEANGDKIRYTDYVEQKFFNAKSSDEHSPIKFQFDANKVGNETKS